MRSRILGIAGTATLAAGLVALAGPQADAQPAPTPSVPRLADTRTPSLPLHRAARPDVPSTATKRVTVNVPNCSTSALIAAINTVNATGGTVNLFPGCTYTLTGADNDSNGLPVITSTVTVTGFNDTITRSSMALFRIFEVDAPGNLTLNSLTLSNGHAPNAGAGVGGAVLVNSAALTLNAARVTNNTADFQGGGIFSTNGTVKVNNSTLSSNTAPQGGGLEANGGSFVFNGGTITGNTSNSYGGGVASLFTTAAFNATRITNNTAVIGGGIAVHANTTLNSSQVTGNTATGSGVLGGGGIYNEGSPLALNLSPVSNNHATGAGSRGGGIFNTFPGAVATLLNTRVSSNSAADNAGGIYNTGGTVNLVTLSQVVSNTPNNCVTSSPAIPGCPN
ncbi:right-handed parallel beta-helix repeat-containing protein [Streptomyces sp. NPDC058457]|uniref:right-handed parallel beta-helix repeat-containing protein n=1 Tax=Streptomyces sp. NPDC058457 TaxID=3346507 RepID=UPI0036675684